MLESVQGSLEAPTSGTYRVRASEVARHRALSCIRVQVLFLDDSTQVFELEKRAKGQVLLDLVFNHLELVERDYFGLQYSDPLGSHDQPWRWLDPLKSVKKQLCLRTKTIGSLGLPVLHFRVKFWVSDPGKLTEEFTRYQMVFQLKKDISQGRLPAPPSTASLLASYVLQAELGDYNPLEHGIHYLSDLQVVPNQTHELVKKVIELHKLHKGQSPSDAEFNYLDHAKRLDLYGVDVHRAKDSTNRDIDIGVTSSGLVVLQNGIKMNTFSWAKIMKVSFKRKQFFIQLRREASENYDSVLGFNLYSYKACKALWKSCVEHHTFFRLHTPRPPSKNRAVLTLGSKFRYSGRTEYQTVEECKKRPMVERSFVRSPSKQFVSQSGAALGETKGGLLKPLSTPGVSIRPRSDSSGYKVTSLSVAKMPKMAWIDKDDLINGESNGISEDRDLHPPTTLPPASSTPSTVSSSASSSTLLDGTISQLFYLQGGASDESSQGVVSICIRPDESGKYGFNVKGGADQKQPVLVSKVAPGTPADRCYPRLNEGDQVLFINGADVSTMTHHEVVGAIRSSHETHTNGLVLMVKQNVYEPEGLEEPAFQYVPEALPTGVSGGRLSGRAGALDESFLLLSEALESGALVAQFEQLYRRKPGLTVSEARKQENEKKNRYRDISPYDATRVTLKSTPSGDYINASYVNMEIPGSGIVNRYIACQGPLSTTSGDFWHMVWEQQSTLVVMLTTVVEQGRIKCHRYWPRLYESVEYGYMKISCTKERETSGFAFREFTLTNTQTEEERHVTHMQYLAWPDHGVPDDSIDFLNFVTKVREARAGMVEPTIVHCSAGIGRTGVLILMETAQCLIEANEPVYPLDIVREMRDQRAMMIQTASQYRFVCEAIQRVYNECIIQPLAEYQQR